MSPRQPSVPNLILVVVILDPTTFDATGPLHIRGAAGPTLGRAVSKVPDLSPAPQLLGDPAASGAFGCPSDTRRSTTLISDVDCGARIHPSQEARGGKRRGGGTASEWRPGVDQPADAR